MQTVNNVLHILNNPVSIAWCQYYCGVRWVNSDKNNPIYPLKDTRSGSVSELVLEYKDLNYHINNRVLYWVAKAGSELAGEPFYYVFFPACSWVFDIRMARQTLIMFSMAMYAGQCLKVILVKTLFAKTFYIKYFYFYPSAAKPKWYCYEHRVPLSFCP